MNNQKGGKCGRTNCCRFNWPKKDATFPELWPISASYLWNTEACLLPPASVNIKLIWETQAIPRGLSMHMFIQHYIRAVHFVFFEHDRWTLFWSCGNVLQFYREQCFLGSMISTVIYYVCQFVTQHFLNNFLLCEWPSRRHSEPPMHQRFLLSRYHFLPLEGAHSPPETSWRSVTPLHYRPDAR